MALFLVLKGDIRERALEDAREQARYMAVAVAVDLLTEEELGGLQSANLYSYAGGDPVNNWDPLGTRYLLRSLARCLPPSTGRLGRLGTRLRCPSTPPCIDHEPTLQVLEPTAISAWW
ncbi:MAG: hypothetical protein ACRDLD_16640 [Thermoleophilaceae bacterium]